MSRYRSLLSFKSEPGVLKQYDLVLRMDLPQLVKDCRSTNNFFHHKSDTLRKITEEIRKKYSCKGFGIEWIDPRPETSNKMYDFMAVYIRITMDYAKKRKRFFELVNEICARLESWEVNLQNNIAEKKKKPLPFPGAKEDMQQYVTQFKYERQSFEVDDNDNKKEDNHGKQLSLDLEKKNYCISLKQYLEKN